MLNNQFSLSIQVFDSFLLLVQSPRIATRIGAHLRQLILFLLLSILVLPGLAAQNRKTLEQKRKKLIADINATSQRLERTTKDREATFDRFVELQEQIARRQELIQTLNEEVSYAEDNILRTSDVITALELDMDRLQSEYGQMIRQTYRQKSQQSSLFFLFSAQSLNQAFRRWQYLRQYNQNRRKTAQLIVSTQASLSEKLGQLEESKAEKDSLLLTEVEQQSALNLEMDHQNDLLESLKVDEAQLAQSLKKQRQQHQRLNTAIEETIRKEIAASRKRARSREALADANRAKNKTKSNRKLPSNPRSSSSNDLAYKAPSPSSSSVLGFEFANNRGRLPWPVNNGTITKYFGKQAHPTLKRIQITNNGIDIKTSTKAAVKAVFKGTIVGVQFIPGNNHMVIIKHGNYYTVYSNLEDVRVRKGDQVQNAQIIGRVSVNALTRQSEVHFEVWRDKTRLNPVHWVQRR